MEKSRPIGVIAFAAALILISVFAVVDLMIKSNRLDFEIGTGILAGCFIPFVLGVGILRLNNIFRLLTVWASVLLIFLVPISFFYFKSLIYGSIGLNVPFGFEWLFLFLFALSSTYYFTRSKVKGYFR